MEDSYGSLEKFISSNNQHEFILEHMSDVVIILDKEGVIRYASPSRKRVFSEKQNPIGHSYLEFVSDEDIPVVKSEFRRLIGSSSENTFTVEFRRRQSKDGNQVFTEGRGRVIYSDNGEVLGAICVQSNITLRKLTEQRIRYLANYDSLTGVCNRRYFFEQFEEVVKDCLQHHKIFLLLFLDLNNFKQVNDSIGHLAGDELLQKVVVRLRHSVPENTIIGRYGGDEFTLLIPGQDMGALLEKVKNRVHHCLSEPFIVEGKDIAVNASIGHSMFPQDGRDVDSLLRVADSAMYKRKYKNL